MSEKRFLTETLMEGEVELLRLVPKRITLPSLKMPQKQGEQAQGHRSTLSFSLFMPVSAFVLISKESGYTHCRFALWINKGRFE